MPTIYALIACAFALNVSLSAVRLLEADRAAVWRDVGAGVPIVAPTLARFTLDLLPLAVHVFVFTWPFGDIAQPNVSRGGLFVVFAVRPRASGPSGPSGPSGLTRPLPALSCPQALAFAASGLGYLCAASLTPSLSPILTGFAVCTFTGLLAGNAPTLREAHDSAFMQLLLDTSFGRWSTECISAVDFGAMPGAYQRQLGTSMLWAMGIRGAQMNDPLDTDGPEDYSLETLLGRTDLEQRGPADVRTVCGPHVSMMMLIGAAFRLITLIILVVRAMRLTRFLHPGAHRPCAKHMAMV